MITTIVYIVYAVAVVAISVAFVAQYLRVRRLIDKAEKHFDRLEEQ